MTSLSLQDDLYQAARQAADEEGKSVDQFVGDAVREVLSSRNGWNELFDQLLALRRLPPGWNGYNAPVPSETALASASEFCRALQARRRSPSRLAASAVGGVAITLRREARKVLVEFFNDGQTSALFADDVTHELRTQAVINSPPHFDLLISDIEASFCSIQRPTNAGVNV